MTQIPAGWEETTLGKKIFIQPWFAFKSSDFEWISNSFVVKIKNIQPPFVVLNSNDTVNILNYSHEKLEKFVVKRGDYLVAMTWETIWKVGKYLLDFDSYLNQRVCKFVDMQKADYKFIYYTLLNSSFQKYINAFSFGAAQANISTTEIWNFQIHLPPLPEQQAIAAVLSPFDDKIELLRAENQTLEQMGQELFKERFGKWKVGDELPEGWRVGKLGEMVDLLNGFSYKSSDFVENGKYRLVTIANVQDWNFIEKTKDSLDIIPEKMPDYCLLKTGDILLSLTWNVGRVCLIIGENYFLNQRVAKISPKNPIDYAYSYLYFRQKHMIALLESISVGTAQQNLSPIKTSDLSIIVPLREILDSFWEKANILVRKIVKNLEQIQSLSATRDQLLQKLMSGEVRVEF